MWEPHNSVKPTQFSKPCNLSSSVVSYAQEGYSGFQVTGMIEGFLWVRNFSIPGVFWVRKFGMYFFGLLDLSRDFLGGIKKNR